MIMKNQNIKFLVISMANFILLGPLGVNGQSGCNSKFTFHHDQIGSGVSFINTSHGTTNHTTYSWNFDDGHSSGSQNPHHSFANPGHYNVCLTMHDNTTGCNSTYCHSVAIQHSGDPHHHGHHHHGPVHSGNQTMQGNHSHHGHHHHVNHHSSHAPLEPALHEKYSGNEKQNDAAILLQNGGNDLSVNFELERISPVTINLLDYHGRLICEHVVAGEVGGNKIELPIEGISNGIYLVKIESPEFTFTNNIVISR